MWKKLSGFSKFHYSLSEEMGKEFRDFCVQHSLEPGKVSRKIMSDFLIDKGIATGERLPDIPALHTERQEEERNLT